MTGAMKGANTTDRWRAMSIEKLAVVVAKHVGCVDVYLICSCFWSLHVTDDSHEQLPSEMLNNVRYAVDKSFIRFFLDV